MEQKSTKGKFAKIKKGFMTVIITVVVLIAAVAVAWVLISRSFAAKARALSELQEQKDLLEKRVTAIKGDLYNSEEENKRILASIAEEEYVFNAEMITEEVKNIGELATVNYKYTNVGTLDASTKFKNTDFVIPGTAKTLVITMDGEMKIGFDVNEIKVEGNEETKTITITLPKPIVLSNELDEDSLKVYEESSGLFSDVTAEDTSSARKAIKSKSLEYAKKNGVYELATTNAQLIIKTMLEAIPGLKDTYTIEFK